MKFIPKQFQIGWRDIRDNSIAEYKLFAGRIYNQWDAEQTLANLKCVRGGNRSYYEPVLLEV